jgi:hypothetical protein
MVETWARIRREMIRNEQQTFLISSLSADGLTAWDAFGKIGISEAGSFAYVQFFFASFGYLSAQNFESQRIILVYLVCMIPIDQ